MRLFHSGLLALLVVASVSVAQEKAPTLTAEQKLQLQVISQKLEIAQLKAQAAQRDFDAARADLQALLKALDKEGYTLDLQLLTYVKKDVPKKQ